MKQLIKNGDIIFDGIHNRAELEKMAFEKLEKYQNIEDELGIDLVTLFKALKNGFWYKKENDILYISKNDYLLSSGAIHFVGKGLIFAGLFLPFKDYGKTWSLDKNDLTRE